ncbi:MAG: type II toxin-antitoxin system Phd/YefM family antitoxin [Myxococcales bacterium]|nr:type II toxin-antitoxin system Phd/YefM family antitoxin [Myxococcales bacterium]
MVKRKFETAAAEPRSPYGAATRTFQVAEDIIPIAELKAKLSEVVRSLDARPRPLVITLNGKPAAVVMSPREYDQLVYRQHVLSSIADGLADAAAGNVSTSDEVLARLKTRYGIADKRKRR